MASLRDGVTVLRACPGARLARLPPRGERARPPGERFIPLPGGPGAPAAGGSLHGPHDDASVRCTARVVRPHARGVDARLPRVPAARGRHGLGPCGARGRGRAVRARGSRRRDPPRCPSRVPADAAEPRPRSRPRRRSPRRAPSPSRDGRGRRCGRPGSPPPRRSCWRAPGPSCPVPRDPRLGAPVALAWAAALATLSLFLVRPNVDDAYYLRQATWIAEHGRFPLGDTLHSHDALPAVFSPPLPSYEPLLGAVAGAAGVSAPGSRSCRRPGRLRARRARAVAAAAHLGGPARRARADGRGGVPAHRRIARGATPTQWSATSRATSSSRGRGRAR